VCEICAIRVDPDEVRGPSPFNERDRAEIATMASLVFGMTTGAMMVISGLPEEMPELEEPSRLAQFATTSTLASTLLLADDAGHSHAGRASRVVLEMWSNLAYLPVRRPGSQQLLAPVMKHVDTGEVREMSADDGAAMLLAGRLVAARANRDAAMHTDLIAAAAREHGGEGVVAWSLFLLQVVTCMTAAFADTFRDNDEDDPR
jgi:hypothetical protein